jgi:hypothetical protein
MMIPLYSRVMTVRDVVFDDGDLVLKKGTIGMVVDVAKSKDGKEYVSFETEDPRYAVFPVFQLAPLYLFLPEETAEQAFIFLDGF